MVLPNLEQGKRKSSVDEGIGGHVLGSDYKIESVKKKRAVFFRVNFFWRKK